MDFLKRIRRLIWLGVNTSSNIAWLVQLTGSGAVGTASGVVIHVAGANLVAACVLGALVLLFVLGLSLEQRGSRAARNGAHQGPNYDDLMLSYGTQEIAGVYPGIGAAQRIQVRHDNAVLVRDQFDVAARRMRAFARSGTRGNGWPVDCSWENVRHGLSSERGFDHARRRANRAAEVLDWANTLDAPGRRERLLLLARSRYPRAAERSLTRFLSSDPQGRQT